MEHPVETQHEDPIQELEQIVRELAMKHNDLVVSVSLAWSEILRATSDPIVRRTCENRLEESGHMFFNANLEGFRPVPLPLMAETKVS